MRDKVQLMYLENKYMLMGGSIRFCSPLTCILTDRDVLNCNIAKLTISFCLCTNGSSVTRVTVNQLLVCVCHLSGN